MNSPMINTPAAWGEPLFSAVLKEAPADFRVSEVLGIQFEEQGEHLYLQLQKTGMNSDELAKLLEAAYSVGSKDIGMAGMKDRNAVTSQWFSVTTPENAQTLSEYISSTDNLEARVEILDSRRHSRKLRRGAHQANEFDIRLHQVRPSTRCSTDELHQNLASRIRTITEHGFPNYIGPQRFGFGGQNLVRARQWFRQPKKRASRQQRSLWLSSARSAIFNAVCAKRVLGDTWREILPGEPAVLGGSRSFFDTTSSSADELNTRLAEFDIHPSAPWWGRGRTLASDECERLEASVIEEFSDFCSGLERAGLSQERRSIRAQAEQITVDWLDESTLRLKFLLSPGVFATTFLAELGLCHEPDRRQQ